MIKFIRTIGRTTGSSLSHEEFVQHHGSSHLTLFEQCPGFVMRVQGYVQNFIIVDAEQLAPLKIPALQTDRDSLIEVWWDSVSEMEKSLSDPKYLELVRPDETSFADVATLQDVIADEFEVMRRPETIGPIKLFRFIKRAASVSRSDFGHFWREHHGKHMTATAAFVKYIGRYVQNHAIAADSKATETMTDYDCVEEFWLEQLGDLGRLYADAEWLERATADEASMLDSSRTMSIVAVEQTEATQWLRRVKAGLGQPSTVSED
jgi:hypothetical protein